MPNRMKRVQLNNTDLELSLLGLGTMYFGSKVEEQMSFRLMDMYLEAGGNFLDSANKYASWIPGSSGGESEIVIGKWVKQRGIREKVLISSKVGFAYGQIPRSLRKEIIISECERSLKRLGTGTIDLFFAHAFDAMTPAEESMEAFFRLKKSGKIRFAGASNFPVRFLDQAVLVGERQGWEGFCCLQQRHTYLEPSLRADFGNQLVLTPDLTDYCRDHELGIMAYSPLLGGIYGRNDRELPPQYRSLDSEQKLSRLETLSRKKDAGPNQLVLAWMLHSSPIVLPLITGSNEKQICENLDAAGITLTNEEMNFLNEPVVEPTTYDS